jgi:hypothetical protein
MLKPIPIHCTRCDQPIDDFTSIKCPICFKVVCRKCARAKGGKEFCSQFCAEYFFHYEED